MNEEKHQKKHRLTYTQIIALSFFCIIIIGGFLLTLPIASKSGERTNPINAFFTATSASCVTGLAVYNTGEYWSLFGQIVILILIQTGGLGLMTFITVFSMLVNRKIGLQEKRLLMQSAGNMTLSGMTDLIKKIVIGTLSFELFGAVLLSFRFCTDFGIKKGIYFAVFHSVSAFCNAGFDLLGQYGQSSFNSYYSDPLINLTIMFLIITGGLGFIVWEDIIKHKFRFKQYKLHSKIVLITTFLLLFSGFIIFFFSEYKHSMRDFTLKNKILASMFQSVTLRTAGFTTVDQSALSETGSIVSTVLMLIGGSPGSTAGGLKTTTIAVIFASSFYAGRNIGTVTMFKKQIDEGTVRQAGAILHIYLVGALTAAAIMCAAEPITLRQAVYETVSAIGTVGLSMNVTPSLSIVSKIMLIILMYSGRLGGLSMMLVLAEKRNKVQLNRPTEKILIG